MAGKFKALTSMLAKSPSMMASKPMPMMRKLPKKNLGQMKVAMSKPGGM